VALAGQEIFTHQPLAVSQSPLFALPVGTARTLSGSPTTVALGGGAASAESMGATDPGFDILPAWLAAGADRIDLPTERDILSGMDIAGSLLTGSRPQANLIPQQQDTVVAIGALLPGESEDGSRKSTGGRPGGEEKIDLRAFLISPVEDTLIGPTAIPAAGRELLDLAWLDWTEAGASGEAVNPPGRVDQAPPDQEGASHATGLVLPTGEPHWGRLLLAALAIGGAAPLVPWGWSRCRGIRQPAVCGRSRATLRVPGAAE
jgi:hypothetical protein